MGGRLPLALSLGLSALCGCRGSTVPSPAGDVATSQAEASRRTGRDLSAPWAPPSSDPAIPGPVAELLRRPLTEENAIRVAILNNRKVRAAYEELGIARAELVQAGVLQQIAAGAGLDGGHHVRVVSEDADHQHLAVRVPLQRMADDLGARAVGQPQVGEDEVGPVAVEPVPGLADTGAAAGRQARHPADRGAQPLQRAGVVLDDEQLLRAR